MKVRDTSVSVERCCHGCYKLYFIEAKQSHHNWPFLRFSNVTVRPSTSNKESEIKSEKKKKNQRSSPQVLIESAEPRYFLIEKNGRDSSHNLI